MSNRSSGGSLLGSGETGGSQRCVNRFWLGTYCTCENKQKNTTNTQSWYWTVHPQECTFVALRKSTCVSGEKNKKLKKQSGRRFSVLRLCLSSVHYTVAGTRWAKWAHQVAISHHVKAKPRLSRPFSATCTNVSSTSIRHQWVPLGN